MHQAIDELLLTPAVVVDAARRGTCAAVAVCRRVDVESSLVLAAAIEEAPERKAEACALRGGRCGVCDGRTQSSRQAVVGEGQGLKIRVARQSLKAARVERQHSLVECARLAPAPEILIEVGEVEQRRGERSGVERRVLP